MSDTITCPNCTATLPAAAAFCTSCGTRLDSGAAGASAGAGAGAAPSEPNTFAPPPPTGAAAGAATFPPPATDPTRVDGPPVTDPTQVYGGAPAAPPPPASSAPWQPADASDAAAWAPPPAPTTVTPAASGYTAPPTTATGQTPAWSPTTWEGAPAQTGATKSTAPGSPIGAILAILGGVLTLVGIFMPWVKSNLSDAGLSGWDLTSGDKGFRLPDGALLTFESMDPYAILAIAVGALLAGVMALNGGTRNISRILGLVLGVAIIGYMVRDWLSLADVVATRAPATFEVSSDIGFYLTIAGGALVIISALMPSKAKTENTTSPVHG